MQPFTRLRVRQRAHAFALEAYTATARFPASERFGLTAQIRRAAVSVTANIAEGSRRRHDGDFARFLNIAEASLAEVEALVMIGRDLDYLERGQAIPLLDEASEIGRMLCAFRMRVESRTPGASSSDPGLTADR